MGRFYIDGEDLQAFVLKVRQLRADGLSVAVIAERLGVPRTTINDRLRKYRDEYESANVAERQTHWV